MRNFYTIIVLFLFCIISACNKDKANESEAIDNKVSLSRKEMIAQRWQGRIDTVSYAIGVDVAMRLEQQFDKINYERINQAIADYYSGFGWYGTLNNIQLDEEYEIMGIDNINDYYDLNLKKSP